MSARRPVIGISGAIESVRWGVWEAVCDISPRPYALAVQHAGGLALVLAADDAVVESPDELLDLLDGLILAGGADIDPATYGARPHPQTGQTWAQRDRFELALGTRALERDLPLLGICRGMQMLNVICGGTLDQHLPDTLGHEAHRHTPGSYCDHTVRLQPGSLAARAAGAQRSAVRSHHHQGIATLGQDLTPTGHAHHDNLIEAIELPAHRFALGVLWHPEEDQQNHIINAFVQEARQRRGAGELPMAPTPPRRGGHG
jgi:putative glutamine amidotransferase